MLANNRNPLVFRATSFLLCAALILLFITSAAHAQSITATVTSGTGPFSAAVNPVTNKTYIVNRNSNNVTVIDGATNTTSTVTVGNTPVYVGVNTVTNKIYVSNAVSNNVSVIDGATNTVTATVTTGGNPDAVVINPVTNKIYVANQGGNNVTVIDGATNATATVTNGNGLGALAAAVNVVTNKIYVVNFNSNNVTVIDGATNSFVTVAAGTNPAGVTVNPVTNKIYVTNLNSANVTVIDGATNATSTLTAGTQPAPLAVNALTNQIYVANQGSNNMTVIDGASNTVTATVGVGALATGIAVNPVTNQIYVTGQNDNSLTVIDGATNKTTTLTIGTAPTDVAVNPVTNKIYAGNFGADNVSVVDGATNTSTTVTAGTTPFAVAVNSATNKIYVANRDSNNVTVIDGVTSATTAVAVGASPQHIAVNPLTNKIYVLGGALTVIDGATNTTTNIPCSCNASSEADVEVNTATNKIYVTVATSALFVVDGATNATTPITADQTFALAVNPGTNRIYLANFNNTVVTVVDGLTNSVITTVPTGTNPTAIAINSVTNKIYVANNGSNNVTVIDGATNTPTTVTDPNGIAPVAVVVNSTTNKAYVLNTGNDGVTPGSVTVIDGATNNFTNVSSGLSILSALAINPVTNKIYLANNIPSFAGPSNVKEIDGASNTIHSVLGTGAAALAVNPVTNTVFVALGAVTVIAEQQAEAIPLTTTITPLVGNQTASPTPTFTFTATSTFAPTAPPVNAVDFQLDTWQGPWIAATLKPGGGFTGTAPTLGLGPHILYAYATDGQDSSSNMSNTNGGSSPLIGAISSYSFTVSTPSNAATHFSVTAPGTATAGTAFNVTVTALDASNATAPGYAGTVHFTSTDGAATLPADATLTNGVGTFPVTLETSGNQTVTATDTVTSSITGTSANITVTQPPQITLRITLPGSAFGNVTDNLGKINCTQVGATNPSGNCQGQYNVGTQVVLTATTPGTFAGFSGTPTNCSGTGPTCAVTLTVNDVVSATFNPGPATFALTVQAGTPHTGGGTISSSPGTIACILSGTSASGTCTQNFPAGTIVTMSSLANGVSQFFGWTGTTPNCLASSSVSCVVAITAAQTVVAQFTSGGGPGFSSTTLPGGAITVPYGADIQATGGTPPYSFALANGSTLPSGFSLSPTSNGTVAAGHVSNASPAAAGTFTFAVTVTDSSVPALTATATISMTIAAAPPNTQPGLLNGQYALLLIGFEPSGFEDGAVGSLSFDGKNAVAGIIDLNSSGGVRQSVAVTGTYSIGPDNRGVAVLNDGLGTPLTLAISVGSTYRGLASAAHLTFFINIDGNDQIGSGFLRLQDPTAFTPDTFAGSYAFGLTGQGPQNVRIAELGLITFTNTLGVSGSADVNEGGTLATNSSLSGTYTAPDKNGRIVQTTGDSTNLSNTAIYQVDANEGIAMTLDARSGNLILIGSGLRQTGTFSNTSLAGPDVLSLGGTASNGTSALIGVLAVNVGTPAPSATITADSNDGGTVNIGEVLTGSYAVASTGRGTFTNPAVGTIFYLAQQDRGFMFTTDASVLFGTITPQVGAPFGASPFTNNFYIGQQEPLPGTNSEFSGIGVLGTGNAFTITDDESHSGGNLFFDQALGTFNYTVDSTGHFVMQSATQGTVSGYAVSPFEIALLEQNGPASDPSPSPRPHVVLADTISSAPGVPSPAAPTVNFPTPVAIGSSAQSAPITITNTGLGPLGFTGQNTGNSPDFSASGTCLATALVIIQPQGTCTIIVTFAPTANAEVGTPLTENLLVLTDAASVTITATGTASGTAGPATHFSVTAPASATAGAAFNVTVTALDASNATATSYTGTVHFTSSDTSATLPANSTLTNGVGTFSATLSTAGNQTITATDTVTTSITGTSANIAVSAIGAVQLMVATAGAGTGTVTGSGINCTSGSASGCTTNVTAGTQVTLTELPAANSGFGGWSSVCPSSTSTTCTFTMPATATVVTATFTLNAPTLKSIAVTPANPTEPVSSNLQFTATGTFSDNSTKDITSTVAWASSNPEAATINEEGGLATTGPTANLTTTISATQAQITGSTLLTVSNSPITITVTPPSGGSFPPVPPGGRLAIGLVLTAIPGFTGTVTFGCSTSSPTITCTPDPASVTFTSSGPTQVAFVVNTFCTGPSTALAPSPGGPGFGGGLGLLLLSVALCGLAWTYRKSPRWALSFAMLLLFALGGVACSSLPKGPDGVTPPGNYTVTITATVNGVTTSTAPIPFTVD